MLEFLFLTGLREGELLNLRWEDVILDAVQPRIVLQGKSITETLTVPFSHSSYQIFVKHLKGKTPDDYVFSQKDLSELKPYNRLPIRREKILSGLRCKDIEITPKSLTISFVDMWKPKGKIGAVPLTMRCQEILQTIASRSGAEGFVFQGSYGGKIQNSLLKIIKRIIKEAGINTTGRKLCLHSTRHTFGCTLRNKGVPVETIQGLMRHKDLKDTLHYAKYSITKGAEAVHALDSLVEEQ